MPGAAFRNRAGYRPHPHLALLFSEVRFPKEYVLDVGIIVVVVVDPVVYGVVTVGSARYGRPRREVDQEQCGDDT